MNFHLKDLLVDDDEPKTQPVHPMPPTSHTFAASAPTVAATVAVSGQSGLVDTVDHQDDVYQRLAAKTDWKATVPFIAIQKHLEPMNGMAIDDKTKFSIALKQAQALDGVDPAKVTQTFESMKTVLQDAATAFAQNVASKTASDVDAKKKKAEELQAQVQQLTEEAFAAQQRLQTAQHKFDVAVQTRLTEITQEQAKYASLLA